MPEPRFAVASVPTHAAPGAPATGTRKARKGAAVRHAESRVVVRAPAVAVSREAIKARWTIFDPANAGAPPTEALLDVPAGRVVHLYADTGEGGCLIGDGARIFHGDCSQVEGFSSPVASTGPVPIESTWWLRLGDGAWIEVVTDHIRIKWIAQSFE